MRKEVIVLVGPTAVGKTSFAIKIAKEISGEIIGCDSMQVYKYMDIGTAKPTAQERKEVPHHLIDFVEPSERFSVANYQKIAIETMQDVSSRSKTPIVSGGTGLYLSSLLYEMDFADTHLNNELRSQLMNIYHKNGSQKLYNILLSKNPEAAKIIHPNNYKRIIRAIEISENKKNHLPFSDLSNKNTEFNFNIIVLTRDRDELYERINRRVDILFSKGLVYEVESLLKSGIKKDSPPMLAIGYKEIVSYLEGDYSIERAVELVKRNSRRYAKRQLTWFRRYEDAKWFNLTHVLDRTVIEWVKRKSLR